MIIFIGSHRGTCNRYKRLTVFLFLVCTVFFQVDAFSTPSTLSSTRKQVVLSSPKFLHKSSRSITQKTKLDMSYYNNDDNNSGNKYNIAKEVFDLFSFRMVRNDALIQYSSLNQSEPLRINLYLLLSFFCFSLPSIDEAAFGQVFDMAQTGASIAGGVASLGLFWRECSRRQKQLFRMESELNAQSLPFQFLRTKSLATNVKYVGEFVGRRLDAFSQRRVLVIAGSKKSVLSNIKQLCVLRNRLDQANCLVIVAPFEISGDRIERWDFDSSNPEELQILNAAGSWLGEAVASSGTQWEDYFRTLIEARSNSSNEEGENSVEKDGLIWFGLNYNGRSFGSGVHSYSLRLVELFGSFIRPKDDLVLFDKDTKTSEEAQQEITQLKDAQKQFYDALTGGDLGKMTNGDIFVSKEDEEVSSIISQGGRVDKWELCLQDGARPAGMTTSQSDAWVVGKEGYTTCIEYPSATVGMMDTQPTLLAIQSWTLESNMWKMRRHQTIPWTFEQKAGGTLKCDCRGCVALTRSNEKRTFGGIIG